MRDALRDGRPLTAEDLRRALVATEMVFASDVHGAGTEGETVTGWTDEETVRVLRSMQRTLADVVASVGPPS